MGLHDDSQGFMVTHDQIRKILHGRHFVLSMRQGEDHGCVWVTLMRSYSIVRRREVCPNHKGAWIVFGRLWMTVHLQTSASLVTYLLGGTIIMIMRRYRMVCKIPGFSSLQWGTAAPGPSTSDSTHRLAGT